MAWSLPNLSGLPGTPDPRPYDGTQAIAALGDSVGGLLTGIKERKQEKQGYLAFDKAIDALTRVSGAQGVAQGVALPSGGLAAGLFGGQEYRPGAITRAPLPIDQPSQRVAQAHSTSADPIFGEFMGGIQKGVTNPNGLAAIAATGKRESGFSPDNAFRTWSDPSESGQAGTAGGIMSWRGDRLAALQRFTAANGGDPNRPSPEIQAQFMLQEDPALIETLNRAGSLEEAQTAMNGAWKFAGYNRPGGEAQERLKTAEGYVGQFGAGSTKAPPPASAAQVQAPPAQSSTDQLNMGAALQGLPDGESIKALFRNPTTRPLALSLVGAYHEARRDASDPMKRLAYDKARLEVDALRRGDAKPTDDMRELSTINQQRAAAGLQPYRLDEWITEGKKAGATNVNVGSEKGFDKTVGEGYGKRFLGLQDDAQAAQRALNALTVMERSMADPGFYSGTGAGTVANLKRLGAALGVQGADGIDSIETFSALSKQAALDTMGGSLGSGFSNADRDFVTGQVPTLDNSPQGNEALIGISRKLNQRKQEIAQLAREYAAENEGRIDAGFDDALARWAEKNPLFPPLPQGSGATRGSGGSTGRQRARNPQTGQTMEWDGNKWSPVQ